MEHVINFNTTIHQLCAKLDVKRVWYTDDIIWSSCRLDGDWGGQRLELQAEPLLRHQKRHQHFRVQDSSGSGQQNNRGCYRYDYLCLFVKEFWNWLGVLYTCRCWVPWFQHIRQWAREPFGRSEGWCRGEVLLSQRLRACRGAQRGHLPEKRWENFSTAIFLYTYQMTRGSHLLGDVAFSQKCHMPKAKSSIWKWPWWSYFFRMIKVEEGE